MYKLIKKSILIWRSLLQSELLRNTTILISGTVIAQLIPIFLRPFLSRHYTPETFGAFAVYLGLVGILIVLSSFKFEMAIVLPKRDKDAVNILILSLFLNFIFNVFLLIVIMIWKSSILRLLNLSIDYSAYLYFVPLGTFLYNSYQSINYWLIRKKSFFAITVNKFTRRGFEGVVQSGFAFSSFSKGLILGDIVGQLSNVIIGLFQGIKCGLAIEQISWSKIKYVIIKYSDFPKFNLIPSFMSACSFLLPAIFINKYFSSENAGFFDMSKLLLSIPLALVATSLSNVLLQRISEKYRNFQSIKRELIPILGIVTAIAVVEIVIISLFGVELFKFIFGEKWEFSGKISKILVWSYAFNFLLATFSSIFISMNKIRLLSIWQLFYFISILSLVFFKNYDFNNFIVIYVIIELICSFTASILMLYIVIKYEEKILLMNKKTI